MSLTGERVFIKPFEFLCPNGRDVVFSIFKLPKPRDVVQISCPYSSICRRGPRCMVVPDAVGFGDKIVFKCGERISTVPLPT